MSKLISNKTYQIINGIIWVCAISGLVFMLCALYELNQIQKELNGIKREHHVIIEYKIGADTIYKIKGVDRDKIINVRYGLH